MRVARKPLDSRVSTPTVVETKAPPRAQNQQPFAPAQSSEKQLSPQLSVTPTPSMTLGDAMPAWVPAEFQLKKAAQGLRALLEALGTPAVPAQTLLVTDADHTLVQTKAMTVLRNATTGELARDPVTNEPLKLGAEIEVELAALKQKYPELPWASFKMDFSEFADPKDIARAHLIRTTAHAIRKSNESPDARQVLITARQGLEIRAALEKVSAQRGLGLDAVLSANEPAALEAMGVSTAQLGTAERKALMIAALAELHGATQVTFYDDGDANLARAKELLAAMLPNVKLDIIDIVPAGPGKFAQRAR